MSVKTFAGALQSEQRRPSPAAKAADLFGCLVVSNQPVNRDLFARAAGQWGWETIVCSTVAEASQQLMWTSPGLVFIDLSGDSECELRSLVRQSQRGGSLVVVCGDSQQDAAESEEEIWARQQGIWFFLPGIRQSSSIDLLCRDARTIVARATAAGTVRNAFGRS